MSIIATITAPTSAPVVLSTFDRFAFPSTALSSSTSSTTTVAFPVASPSTLPMASSTPEASQSDSPVTGLSNGARAAVYATTIVGGTFLIALLICVIHRQRIRRRQHQRRRVQQELDATTRPRKRPPGFDDQEMIEASSDPFWNGQQRQHIPSGLAERFRRRDAYIKATLGGAYPMHADPESDDHSSLLPASPPRVLTRIDEAGGISRQNSNHVPEDGKISPLSGRQSRLINNAMPRAYLKRPPTLNVDSQRWSWTNSQAPATPRMYVPTIVSSRHSATRLRMAVNWVKTQGERITSGEAPSSSPKIFLPKPGVLKNQAFKPNLAPNKLVKKNSVRRSSRLSEFERSANIGARVDF